MITPITIVIFNLLVAYVLSFWSILVAVGWFCLAIGFQFGKWHGESRKEEEFVGREELIRDELRVQIDPDT